MTGNALDVLERPLDTAEAIFHAFNSMGAFLTVQVAQVSGPLDPDLLRSALQCVQRRHPLLHARIIDAPRPRWTTAQSSEPPLTVEPGADAYALAQSDLNRVLEHEKAPPWACRFVPGDAGAPHHLVLAMHHALADGWSASQVLSETLASCAALYEGGPMLPPLPPGPPLDDLLPPASLLRILHHRARRVLRLVRAPASRIPLEASAPVESRRSVMLVRTDSRLEVEALQARARAEGTTITGAVSGALLTAARTCWGPAPRRTLGHSISMRQRVRPNVPPEQLGCYVTGLQTEHALDRERPVWVLAREATDGIRRAMARGETFLNLQASKHGLPGLASHLREAAENAATAGRVGGLALSNRGRLPKLEFGPFAVRCWHSGTSNHTIGNLLQLSTATLGNRLSSTLVYVEPLVSRRKAEAFFEAVHETLARAVG